MAWSGLHVDTNTPQAARALPLSDPKPAISAVVLGDVGIGRGKAGIGCDAGLMRRVSVVGNSGAGKTSLARRLADVLEVSHVELDAIFHQPGWTELTTEQLRRRVAEELTPEGWVVDGNYSAVRDLVWQAADTVVWIDRPRPIVMRRLIAGTVRRVVTRQQLWNGNREPLTGMFRRDPRENLIRWSWMKHDEIAQRYARASANPTNAHLRSCGSRATPMSTPRQP